MSRPTAIASVYAAVTHSITVYEPPSSRRIAGAATCAIVVSSRSITAAATAAANASQRQRWDETDEEDTRHLL